MSAYDLEQEAQCRVGQERDILFAAAKIMRAKEQNESERRDIERALENLDWFDALQTGSREPIINTVMAYKTAKC